MNILPKDPIAVSSLEGFSWLQGTWLGESDGVVIEEQWSGAIGDSLMGMFRYIQADEARFFELMTIEMEDEQAVLRIKHFNPGMLGWEEKDESVEYVLVRLEHGEAVFARRRPAKGNWMIYRRTGDDLCVSFESETGASEGEFRFHKVEP